MELDQPGRTLADRGLAHRMDHRIVAGMRLMKKDMGGAAHALALAGLVMAAKLPVRLHRGWLVSPQWSSISRGARSRIAAWPTAWIIG
jgi:hypothetical protein